MYKIFLATLLCLLMTVLFVACNQGDDPAATTAATTADTPSTAATTTATPTTVATTTATPTTAATTTEATTESTSTPTTENVEEKLTAYLSTVEYNSFELQEENQPYFMGRWFEKDIANAKHMVTVTDGSLFYFLTDGATSFNVNFTVITEKDTPYFAYSIDGATPVRQLITNPTVNLPDANPHTVRIIADCMNSGEDKWVGERGFAFKSVTASEGGKIYGIKPTNKIIFYYGDSITEGIQALGLTASDNSATNSYAWVCSELLGATHYSIGYSGTGVTRGIADGKSFDIFTNAIDHLSRDRLVSDGIIPDVIIINHGCNDKEMNTNPKTFANNLKEAITKLQTMYPDTPIYYVVPFDQQWALKLGSIFRSYSIEGVTIIKTADWITEDMYIAPDNPHPSAAGAKILGEKLASALKEQLGEDFFN